MLSGSVHNVYRPIQIVFLLCTRFEFQLETFTNVFETFSFFLWPIIKWCILHLLHSTHPQYRKTGFTSTLICCSLFLSTRKCWPQTILLASWLLVDMQVTVSDASEPLMTWVIARDPEMWDHCMSTSAFLTPWAMASGITLLSVS